MQRRCLNTLLLLGLAIIANGCASTTTSQPSMAAAEAVVGAQAATAESHAITPPQRVDVPIPDASLLPLLEAEFALRAGRFGDALTLFTEQSQLLDDPDLARRALRLAEFLRDNEAALALAMRLSELDPGDGEAAAKAMTLLLRKGDPVQALAFAEQAKQRGARINAPLLIADYSSLGATQRSAMSEGIEALANRWPDDLDIKIAHALLKRELLDYRAASELLDRVLSEEPDETRALVLWTQVQLDLDTKTPFERIADAVGRAPENERLRLQYARLLAANERYEDASRQFTQLTESSPRNDEYLMASALIELELKRYDNAEATLLSLIALQQRVDEAWYYLGRTRQAAGRSDDAIDAYENVGAIQEFVDAKRRAADLLRGTEDEVAVSQFFVEQRTRFQDQAERLYLVEAELQREAAPEAAIATYTQALSEYPASLSLLYGRAMLFEAEGDIAAMETDLRAILAEDPDNATTLNALGYTLTNNTTRYDEAAQLIERALELNPREPAMLDSLGWVYFKMGRFIEAENILREAYELLPDPEVAAHLGETLWSQGKRLEAKDIWRSGLGRDANNVHIRSTLNRLGVALD